MAYTARIKLPASLSEIEIRGVSESLAEGGDACSFLREWHGDDAPWILEWIVQNRPDIQDLSARLSLFDALENIAVNDDDWQVDEIADIDWLAQSYKQFPAFSVGQFYIYGSHCSDPVPADQMGLQIDAATAFGSGEHETTKGCLLALLHMKESGFEPKNVLDMGTGSGILGLAAWKLWNAPVLAVDNDEEAVRVAKVHCKINSAENVVICAYGDSFRTGIVKKRKPYDLVVANILAGTLIEMADDMIRIVNGGGFIILSGILNEQADSVLSVYESYDLVLKERFELGHWTTLLLHCS